MIAIVITIREDVDVKMRVKANAKSDAATPDEIEVAAKIRAAVNDIMSKDAKEGKAVLTRITRGRPLPED